MRSPAPPPVAQNVLTKGVRDELQAREALQAAATLEAGQPDKTASRDDGSAVNGERHEAATSAADSEGRIGAGGGGQKVAKKPKQQPNHRPKGPKVERKWFKIVSHVFQHKLFSP